MDTLKAMQVFVEVAQSGGFAPAAKKLGLSTSSVSRHVTNLEDMLNLQLFNRTTRHLSLTPDGEELITQCEMIVKSVDEMVQTRQRGPREPKGRLRVTMPLFIASILMEDVIARFAKLHPSVNLDLFIADRVVNLVEEGFDLAVRVGTMPDSTLVSRKCLELQLVCIASPEYLADRDTPTSPEDLHNHNCVIDTAAPYRDRWPMLIDGTVGRVHVKGNVAVNSGSAARRLVVGGVGLALLPEYLVYGDIEKGRLVTVLDDFVIDFGGVFMVYPQTRHQSGSVRSFVDLVIDNTKPIRQFRERQLAKRQGVST